VLAIARVKTLAKAVSATDTYDRLALDGALEMLGSAQRKIACDTIAAGGIDDWLATRRRGVKRALGIITTMTDSQELSVSRVVVAADLLFELTREERESVGAI
jgi:glutamate dehydrogenase